MTEARANISPCGTYRYSLSRKWSEGPGVLWVMLNPSTADAEMDDPTIRACRQFSQHWGMGSLEVVNLFALRATDPRRLALAADPVGPENDQHIERAVKRADLIVVAWGAHGGLLGRNAEVRRLLASMGRWPARCLGLTRAGEPRHPLYVARGRPLEWMPANA